MGRVCLLGHGTKLPPVFFDLGREPTPVYDGKLYYGVELEMLAPEGATDSVSRERVCKELHDKFATHRKWFYIEVDPSVYDGLEVIFRPMTWEWIRANEGRFEKFMAFLHDRRYESYDAIARGFSCGMHVHITRRALGPEGVFNMTQFVFGNPALITALSRRPLRWLREYAAVSGAVRHPRLGIVRLPLSPAESTPAAAALDKTYNFARHLALNLRNPTTIEVRMFRGTLSFTGFMMNLEFCHAMVAFCTAPGHTRHEMTGVNFLTWLCRTEGHDRLKEWLLSHRWLVPAGGLFGTCRSGGRRTS